MPNSWILGIVVFVMVVEVRGKYMIIRYLAHSGAG